MVAAERKRGKFKSGGEEIGARHANPTQIPLFFFFFPPLRFSLLSRFVLLFVLLAELLKKAAAINKTKL